MYCVLSLSEIRGTLNILIPQSLNRHPRPQIVLRETEGEKRRN